MITKKELRDFASLSSQIQNSKILLQSLQHNTPPTDDVHASDLLGLQPLVADIESKLDVMADIVKKYA